MSEELYAQMTGCLSTGFDLAGGIHQDLLNDFADAHHRANYDKNDPNKPSIYRGGDVAPELGISKWTYDIANLDLDFSSLAVEQQPQIK